MKPQNKCLRFQIWVRGAVGWNLDTLARVKSSYKMEKFCEIVNFYFQICRVDRRKNCDKGGSLNLENSSDILDKS